MGLSFAFMLDDVVSSRLSLFRASHQSSEHKWHSPFCTDTVHKQISAALWLLRWLVRHTLVGGGSIKGLIQLSRCIHECLNFIPIRTLKTKPAQFIKQHDTYTILMIYTNPSSNLLPFFLIFILTIEDLLDWIYKTFGVIFKQDTKLHAFYFK